MTAIPFLPAGVGPPEAAEAEIDEVIARIRATISSGHDLLPLAPIPMPPGTCSHSRRVRRRARRALELWRSAEQTRITMNTMGATDSLPHRVSHEGPTGRVRSASTAVQRAWLLLLRHTKRLQVARRLSQAVAATGALAVDELTKQADADTYGPWGSGPKYVPFRAALIAEPPIEHAVIPLMEALPPLVAARYANIEDLLLPAAEAAEALKGINLYAYDTILGDRAEFAKYLWRPEAQLLWELIPEEECLSTVSVAAVAKKSGHMLRKIIMSVPFNTKTRTPSQIMGSAVDYGLLGGVALAQAGAPDGKFAVRSLDEGNAFTILRTPEAWWRHHCSPTMLVRELDPRWVRGRWPGDRKVRAAYCRLGMGGTHAAYLLMQVNLHHIGITLRGSRRFANTRLLNLADDRRERIQLSDSQHAVYIHIDDVATLGSDRENTEELNTLLAGALRELGFTVSEDNPMEAGRYIGYTPCCSPAGWYPHALKLGHVLRALEYFGDGRLHSVNALRTTLCVYIWFSLLWRGALSAPDRIFRFCRVHADRYRSIPSCVRRELRLMRAQLTFAFADVALQPFGVVLAQDAACPSIDEPAEAAAPFGAFSLAYATPLRRRSRRCWRQWTVSVVPR